MGGTVVWLKDHARTSTGGRGTSAGQSPSGQFSENHLNARSSRPTLMSDPSSRALSFLPSSKARELTVESGTPSISPYARATRSSCSIPDIPGISVSLPDKSTVKLPDYQPVSTGYSTGMDLHIILANIERRLKKLKMSAHEASLASGHEDVIRNLKRKLKNGHAAKGSLRADTLEDLARTLECTADDLKRPLEATTVTPVPGMREILLARLALLDRERAMIDEQLAELDAAENIARKPRPRKNR
jgi:hypothetical protein